MKKKTVMSLVCMLMIFCLSACQTKDVAKEDITPSKPSTIVEKEDSNVQVKTEKEQEKVEKEEPKKETSKPETTKETADDENPQKEASKTEKKEASKETSKKTTEKTTKTETTKKKKNKEDNTKKEDKEKDTTPKATAKDCKAVAEKVLWYINSYRSTPATKLPGLTKYCEYRSKQLVSNFAHDTDDERAAATALKYGTYIDPSEYGIEGEPYYETNAREAIAKAGYVGSVDEVAKQIAKLFKGSSGHWAYVGSSSYPYIAVGVHYESDMWYCTVAMARENIDNN